MIIKSFENRVNFNGIDYDFDYFGANKSVHLKEASTNRPKVISLE